MDRATERRWVWELPGWPGFTWDDDALRGYVARFVADAAWQSGALAFVGGADALEVHLEWLADEAAETSAIEGESLQRDSIRASLLHFFGLEAALHAPAAERGIARLATDVYDSFGEPLSHDTLWRWHLDLMSSDPGIRELGRYRSGPESAQIVTVRRGSMRSATVNYLAPSGTRIPDEMDAFVEWYNEATELGAEVDALSVAGAAHLYFECIHPFEDGNGRIGRALAEKALARCLGRPSLIPLSTTIHARRGEYYRALESCRRSLDAGTWQTWFARTILDALDQSRLRLIRHAAQSRLFTALDGRLNDRQAKALHRMFQEEPRGFEGGLSAANYQTITGASSATATRDLADLVKAGALRRTGRARHTRYWLNAPELDAARINPDEPETAGRPGPRAQRRGGRALSPATIRASGEVGGRIVPGVGRAAPPGDGRQGPGGQS